MSRVSCNVESEGFVKHGFDYSLQVWVEDFIILPCAHPASMGDECCNQRIYAGRDIREVMR